MGEYSNKLYIKTGTDELIDNFVTESLFSAQSQNPELYATAADYYYFGNKDLERALSLVDLAIKKGPESWHYRLKMDILARMNRHEQAAEVGLTGINFIKERADQLGWDALTEKRSIEQYRSKIDQSKALMERQ